MKLLTIAVPCYNSEGYMENCIKSLLIGGKEVEILIVDDGSSDRTGEIADRLEAEHPGIIRAIHQVNKGHGGAVNTGIANATGLYFKVVDSDDKVRPSAYKSILDVLRRFSMAAAETDTGAEEPLDLLISNFVYNKEDQNRHTVMQYRHCLPVGRVFSWDEAKHFPVGKYILMHSVIFRTQMLRESGLQLPEHTFYVDNIFAFHPLPYVKKMYYIDTNFYRYFIGREDQSVNEKVMIGRIDQQLKVNKLMVDYITDTKITNRKAYKYMLKYLDIITTVSSIMLIRAKTEEALEKKEQLWQYIRERNPRVFCRLRYGLMGNAINLPGKGGRSFCVAVYKLAQRVMKFN